MHLVLKPVEWLNVAPRPPGPESAVDLLRFFFFYCIQNAFWGSNDASSLATKAGSSPGEWPSSA